MNDRIIEAIDYLSLALLNAKIITPSIDKNIRQILETPAEETVEEFDEAIETALGIAEAEEETEPSMEENCEKCEGKCGGNKSIAHGLGEVSKPSMDWEEEFDKEFMEYAYENENTLLDCDIEGDRIKQFIKEHITKSREEGYKKGSEEEREKMVEMVDEFSKCHCAGFPKRFCVVHNSECKFKERGYYSATYDILKMIKKK